MSDLAISNIIKIILGVLVFAVILIALSLFFKDKFLDFFKNFLV